MEANVVVRRKTVASGNGKDKSSRRNSLQVSRRLSAISTVSNFTSSSLSRTDSEKNTDGGEFMNCSGIPGPIMDSLVVTTLSAIKTV